MKLRPLQPICRPCQHYHPVAQLQGFLDTILDSSQGQNLMDYKGQQLGVFNISATVPSRAIGAAGVAALWGAVVHGVVAPVEGVLGGHPADSLLLLFRLWSVLRQVLLQAHGDPVIIVQGCFREDCWIFTTSLQCLVAGTKHCKLLLLCSRCASALSCHDRGAPCPAVPFMYL